MSQNVIELGFDVDKLLPQQKKVVQSMIEVYDLAVKLDGFRITFDNIEGWGEFKKAAADLRKVQSEINDLKAAHRKLLDERNAATAAAKKNGDTELSAYDALKKKQKEAASEALNLAAKYGVLDESAQAAAARAQDLKKQLEEVSKIIKAVPKGKEAAIDIPFTTNLDDLQKELADVGKTGSVVNDIEKAQVEATAAATDWANELRNASEAVAETADEVKHVAGFLDDYIGSIRDNIRAQMENTSAITANKERQKELQKEIDATGQATDGQINRMVALKQEEQLLNEAKKSLALTIRNQAKELTTEAGSIDELRAKVSLLQHAYEQMGDAERESGIGLTLKAQIDELEPKVKELEASVGKYQRNVGNYSAAMDVLSARMKELPGLIERLTKEGNANAAAIQALQREYNVLGGIVENRAAGFKNMQQEIKANVAAMQALENEGLKDTQMYVNLFNATTDLQDRLNDIREEIKFTADNQSGIDQLANNVKQLAAAYQIAEGAAALFGLENEDLEETMTRLMAVQNIANGVFELQEEIKRKGSIANTIAVAGQKLYQWVITGSTKATVVNTAAEQANSAAARGNAAAQGAQAAATETTTVATRSATGAMIGLRAALIATGIGALLVLLPMAANAMGIFGDSVDEAAEKENALADAIRQANEAILAQNEALDAAQKDGLRLLENEISLREKAGVTAQEAAANKKALADQERINAVEQLKNLNLTDSAIDKMGATIQKQQRYIEYLATAEIKARREGNEKRADLIKKQIDVESNAISSLQSLYKKGIELIGIRNDAEQKAAEVSVEIAKMQADDQNRITLEAARLRSNAIIDANNRILADEKSTLQQRLTATSSVANQQKVIARAELNAVLADNTKSNADKLIAQRSYSAQVLKIDKDLAIQRQKIEEDYRQRDLAANFAIIAAKLSMESDAAKRLSDLETASYADRLQAYKRYLEIQKVLADADYKLKLQQAGISDEEIKALEADSSYRVKRKKITDAELLKLQKDHETAILKLGIEGQSGVQTIIKSSLAVQRELHERHIKDLQRIYDQLELSRSKQYAKDVIRLNQFLSEGLISYREYLRRRQALDFQFSVQQQADNIANLQGQIEQYAGAEERKASIKDRIEQLKRGYDDATSMSEKARIAEQLTLSDEQLKNAESDSEQKLALEKQLNQDILNLNEQLAANLIKNKQAIYDSYKELARGVVDLLVTMVDAGYEKQKNAVQAQIDLNDERYAKEIEDINNSRLAEQEKADQVKVLEQEQAAQKSLLEKKQRDIDIKKARFDKAVQIANITATAAQTVFKLSAEAALAKAQAAYLAANPLTVGYSGIAFANAALIAAQIPIVIAISAAQIAKAAVTPIPAYSEGAGVNGRPLHPGGLALVGERKDRIPERVDFPSGYSFIADNPTIVDLPMGTKVTPLVGDVVDDMMLYSMTRHNAEQLKAIERYNVRKAGNHDLIDMMRWQTNRIEKALAKQRANKTIIEFSYNEEFERYLDKRVRGKA